MKKTHKICIILSFTLVILFLPLLLQKLDAEAKGGAPVLEVRELAMLQENSLAQISSPKNPDPKVVKTINATITAYSSTPDQTDDTPFITAAGTAVRDGIIANNLLPFGTKVRMPQIYGDKIFVVEDRMHQKWSTSRFDVWFESTREAKIFGIKNTEIEVLE
jgi:3D (Asp-Asp-Asp) domain-containing protein